MLKPGIIQCLLTKFGQGAEHKDGGDYNSFKVYLDPDNVEEGEEKVEVITQFLHDDDVQESDDPDDNHVIQSKNKELAERTLEFLQQCAIASQTAAARRKSKKTRKSRGKAKKTRKQTKRR